MNSLAKIALIAIGASAKKINPLDSISQFDYTSGIVEQLLKKYGMKERTSVRRDIR